jgi:hypothetical protein
MSAEVWRGSGAAAGPGEFGGTSSRAGRLHRAPRLESSLQVLPEEARRRKLRAVLGEENGRVRVRRHRGTQL